MNHIKLSDIDTRAPKHLDKKETKDKLRKLLEDLDEQQNLLYAESKHSILVVIQGMDASGKDGLTKHVFGSMNPQGVVVKSYKAPTPEELSHDFLWRIHQHSPAKGMIQIFNRSHYEDVLVTRVHGWCDNETAKLRMRAINDFERLLHVHGNTKILKFYLHISPEEQQIRLDERMQNPAKMWKYNEKDFEEAKFWDQYQNYYEEMFKHTSEIPWNIIPSDQNWYKEYLVADKLHETMKDLKMQFPGIKK